MDGGSRTYNTLASVCNLDKQMFYVTPLVMFIAEKVANLKLSKSDVIVLDFFSCMAYMGTDLNDLPARFLGESDCPFHIQGNL